MLKIKPADMRFRVTIQEKQRVQDSNGILTDTWVDIATDVRASVRSISGRELIAVSQNVAQYDSMIIIYKRDINESMRIVFDGRNYDIEAIIPDVTNEVYTTLMCKTGYVNG